jgi:hypothetical protein
VVELFNYKSLGAGPKQRYNCMCSAMCHVTTTKIPTIPPAIAPRKIFKN